MFDAVTIGSATRDAFFEGDFGLAPWPKAESGKAYILPLGEKIEVEKVYFTIGGNSANAAVTFARQGFKTACLTKVGKDVSGEEIRRRLKGEKVETKFISSNEKIPTSYSVLLLKNGERTILNYHGAGGALSYADARRSGISSGWFYVSLSGESDKMLKPLLRSAADKKTAVAFNPSGHHIKHKRNEILSSLEYVSFLVLNEEEASLLTGVSFSNENAVFKKLDKLMPGILAVTGGRTGVTVSDGRFAYKAGIFPERKLVDRTGAGDAFGSGFIAGLMRKGHGKADIEGGSIPREDVKYAIRLATANATSVVEKIGATEGILTGKEFERNRRWQKLKIEVKKLRNS